MKNFIYIVTTASAEAAFPYTKKDVASVVAKRLQDSFPDEEISVTELVMNMDPFKGLVRGGTSYSVSYGHGRYNACPLEFYRVSDLLRFVERSGQVQDHTSPGGRPYFTVCIYARSPTSALRVGTKLIKAYREMIGMSVSLQEKQRLEYLINDKELLLLRYGSELAELKTSRTALQAADPSQDPAATSTATIALLENLRNADIQRIDTAIADIEPIVNTLRAELGRYVKQLRKLNKTRP